MKPNFVSIFKPIIKIPIKAKF